MYFIKGKNFFPLRIVGPEDLVAGVGDEFAQLVHAAHHLNY